MLVGFITHQDEAVGKRGYTVFTVQSGQIGHGIGQTPVILCYHTEFRPLLHTVVTFKGITVEIKCGINIDSSFKLYHPVHLIR